ncbi:hypothetical protein JX266_012963 [Neoarthrinium moseri]|nr:hypothetical protein JX266_012963 [Neoarthrinium moseri]
MHRHDLMTANGLSNTLASILTPGQNICLRATIRPTRSHHVERLLAVECLEEFGGPALNFRARDNAQEPAWDDKEIERMRWACTHCLRLLDHTRFDNHSLLRLGYRKPLPGSPAASPVTSWRPSGSTSSKSVLRNKKATHQAEMKSLRLRYAVAVTLNWGKARESQASLDRLQDFRNAGFEAFEQMSLTEFEALDVSEETKLLDQAARSVELQICGYKRHLRSCNECRFQTGNLKSYTIPPQPNRDYAYQTGSNLGTKTVPIVKSRRYLFGDLQQRYFPGLFMNLPSYRPECDKVPSFMIYRQDSRGSYFNMYMIRCPGCCSWKDMAAYRVGNVWPKWWVAYQHHWGADTMKNWDGRTVNEAFLEGLRCHSCYAKENGREKFAQVLLEWYMCLLFPATLSARRNLDMGWTFAWQSVNKANNPYVQPNDWSVREKYIFNIRTEILAGIPWKNTDKRNGVDYKNADAKTLDMLREKHAHLKASFKKWYHPPDPTHHLSSWNDWYGSWVNGYEAQEAQWLWLRDCKTEVLKRPEAVVNWALGDQEGVDIDAEVIWNKVCNKYRKIWDSEHISEVR